MALNRFQGYAERGGADVVSSLTGTRLDAQRSCPGASVKVYVYGTSTLATIYSDSALTPKANPFTASADGLFDFHTNESRVSVEFTGCGMVWTHYYESGAGSAARFPPPWLDIRDAAADVGTGNNAANTLAIDLTLAEVLASGGTMVIPGNPLPYFYEGIGWDHMTSAIRPLFIQGSGIAATRVQFAGGVTKPQCIRIGSTAGVGSGLTHGGGIRDIQFNFQAGKPGIVIESADMLAFNNIYTFGGTVAFRSQRARSLWLTNFSFSEWTENAIWIDDNGSPPIGSQHHIEGGFINSSDPASGYAFVLMQTGDNGTSAPDLINLTCNDAGLGGFLLQNTGTGRSTIFPFFVNLKADGPFPIGLNMVNVSQVDIVNSFFVAQTRAIQMTNCSDIRLHGGTAYAGNPGAADIGFADACDHITIVGVACNGPIMTYAADDGTTHTNMYFDNPPGRAADGTGAVSNDLTKFEFTDGGCTAYSAVNVALAHNTNVPVPFDTHAGAPNGWHSTSVNPTRFTALHDGRFTFTGGALFDANVTGSRRLRFVVDGVEIRAEDTRNANATTFTAFVITMTLELARGQYVELWAFQDSTVSLDLIASTGSQIRTFMQVTVDKIL
jgi:hypothetical protein